MTTAAAAVTHPDELVCVELDSGAGEAWLQCADVLSSRGSFPHPAAVRLARSVLLRYPGCLLTVVARREGGFVIGLRATGGLVVLFVVRGGGPAR
ncbi:MULTISPECIES: hypothetical protein [unclassified Streptomyces]|uniref:hypothetical protein n=1 Tax=unclassified Streptomyces TaxID=2593676 RepID=UPI002E316BA4|nr:hypothetical protein [Streptomyces sp. NBC_01268]